MTAFIENTDSSWKMAEISFHGHWVFYKHFASKVFSISIPGSAEYGYPDILFLSYLP